MLHHAIPASGNRRRLSLLAVITLLLGFLAAIAMPGTAYATTSVAVGDFVFEQHVSGGDSDIVLDHGGSETTLTSGKVDEFPDVSPDGSKIVYTRQVTGGYDAIFVMSSDGSGNTQLTNPDGSDCDHSFHDFYPKWSRDGTKIAFNRNINCGGTNEDDVWVMNADGSGATDLTPSTPASTSIYNVVWSLDGSKLAFTESSGSPYYANQVVVMSSSGGTPVVVSPSAASSGCNDWYPDWSADGSRIYVSHLLGNPSCGTPGGAEVDYITSTDGFASAANSTLHQLVTGVGGGGSSLVRISGDGETVYFDSNQKIYSAGTSSSTSFSSLSPIASDTGDQDIDSTPVNASWPNAPTPSWWSGTCDSGNNSGSAALTHSGTTTSFYGVTACGGGSSVNTTFGGQSVSETEWQCTELVLRYMYLRWGVLNYVADGYQIVSNYSGSTMTKVTNTGSNLPSVGDVISFNRHAPYNLTSGHTAIVTAVSGSAITTMEQNNGSTGIGSVAVSGGGVSTTLVNGWLHHP